MEEEQGTWRKSRRFYKIISSFGGKYAMAQLALFLGQLIVCHDPSGFVSWLMNNMPWPKWLCFLVVCHDPSGFVSWLYAMTQMALFLGFMPWSGFCFWKSHTPNGFVSCKGTAALIGHFYTPISSIPKINEGSGIVSLFVYFYYVSVITLNTQLFGIFVPLLIGGGGGEEYLSFFKFYIIKLKISHNRLGMTSWKFFSKGAIHY